MLGLMLSFMIGPLFFAVMQGTLERGFRGGLSVAAGIWVSDIGFVVLVQQGLAAISHITAQPHFKLWLGIAGGLLLIGFGVANIWSSRVSKHDMAKTQSDWDNQSFKGMAIKGFLINTVNPGTILFWIGISTGLVAPNQWTGSQTWMFFSTMLLVLCATDLLKIYAARKIRNWLTPKHIQLVRRWIGIALIIFGLFLFRL